MKGIPLPGAGERWAKGRYDGPYLRDALMDAGFLVQTPETSATWSSPPTSRAGVRGPGRGVARKVDGSPVGPSTPRAVSGAKPDVAPGSGHGTIVLVGHINYAGVAGAFANRADYRVGQIITLVLADGRRMTYAVAAPPIEVNKNALGPRREELFDQSHSYGMAGRPKSGRLLLLSCGGVFDNRTGHYESNILVYALPA